MKGTAKQKQAIAAIALPALMERLGGEVTITEAELDAMQARWGQGKLSVVATWDEKQHSLHPRVARCLPEPVPPSN